MSYQCFVSASHQKIRRYFQGELFNEKSKFFIFFSWYPLREKSLYSKFFWSVFSSIQTAYSARMREKMDHKNSEYGHFSRIVPFDTFFNILSLYYQMLPRSSLENWPIDIRYISRHIYFGFTYLVPRIKLNWQLYRNVSDVGKILCLSTCLVISCDAKLMWYGV